VRGLRRASHKLKAFGPAVPGRMELPEGWYILPDDDGDKQ